MIPTQFTPITGRWPSTEDEWDTDGQQTDFIVPVLKAGTACTHCTAVLPVLPSQWLPTAVQGVLGVTAVMEKNTRNVFFSFRQRRKCHIWTVTAARLGKGQGTERREAVDWHSIAQRMCDRWQIWQQGGHRVTCKLFLLQEHTTQHCIGAASPAWQVCWGDCILSNMLHPKGSIRDAPWAVQPWEKAVQDQGENGRKAEIVPGFSSQAYLPCTQSHTGSSGKGQQPLCWFVHSVSSTGSSGSHPLPST